MCPGTGHCHLHSKAKNMMRMKQTLIVSLVLDALAKSPKMHSGILPIKKIRLFFSRPLIETIHPLFLLNYLIIT